MIKFLPGLLLLEAVSVAVLFALLEPQNPLSWLKIAAILVVMALIISFWFDALSKSHVKDRFVAEKEAHLETLAAEKDAYRQSLAAEKEAFAREREEIRIKAELEKQKMLQQAHAQIQKETRSVQNKASLKVGAALTGLGAGGVLLLLTELFTLGLMTLMTAGGALGGYVLRGRQQGKGRLAKGDKDIIEINPKSP